jgi:hypothetical protein
MDSAFDKTIEKVAGSSFNNALYPPYTGLNEKEFAEIEKGMKAVLAKYKK